MRPPTEDGPSMKPVDISVLIEVFKGQPLKVTAMASSLLYSITTCTEVAKAMAKTKKDGNKKAPARKRSKSNPRSGQTNEPFEQNAKRPIGQHGASGRPPLMKK